MIPTSATPRLIERSSISGQHSSRRETLDQPAVYEYEPIREADEIRLLHLHQGNPEDITRADLETVRISENRHYDAISYTSADENGDTTKSCSLQIGSPGVSLPITCDSVLRWVCKYTSLIWIDAMCIDQENVRGRSKQVDLMPMIYKGASRTFAYVGDPSEDSGLVLKNLAAGIWTPSYLLDSFFARPYFSRVWVMQEVSLSKCITMMCGDIAVQWTKFLARASLKRIHTSNHFEAFPTILRLDQRYLISSATILDALLLGRNCIASDPRDKVFWAARGGIYRRRAVSQLFYEYRGIVHAGSYIFAQSPEIGARCDLRESMLSECWSESTNGKLTVLGTGLELIRAYTLSTSSSSA